MEVLVVNGYIRQVQQAIKPKIIPTSINQICYNYYYYKNIVIYAGHSETKCKCIVGSIDMHNIPNCKSWKCNIYSLNNNTLKIDADQYLISTGSAYAQNVILPNYISQKLIKTFKKLNIKYSNRVHSIFTNVCAITFCDSQLQQTSTSNSDITAFFWELPVLSAADLNLKENNLIYTPNNGLFSIGGYVGGHSRDSLHNLNFNVGDEMITDGDWKWEQLQNMRLKRLAAGCCMIGENYIVVAGGFVEESCEYSSGVEMYDINENKWTDLGGLNVARSDCSMYYDKLMSDRIYIGGSDGVRKPVEYYDFEKNKWYDGSPVTTLKHAWNSVLWIENKYLLYIASVHARNVEFIDLREDNKDKKWNIVYENARLERLFATTFEQNAQSNYRLLRC